MTDNQAVSGYSTYCIKRSTSIFSFCRCHKRGVTVERVAAWESIRSKDLRSMFAQWFAAQNLHRQIRRNHYEALNNKSTLTRECTRGAGIILTGYCNGWILGSYRPITIDSQPRHWRSGVSDYFQYTIAVGEASISHRSWYRPILWIETCKYNC